MRRKQWSDPEAFSPAGRGPRAVGWQRNAIPHAPQRVFGVFHACGETAKIIPFQHLDAVAKNLPEIEDLLQRAVRDDFVYNHQWRKGDFLLWDNRAAMHRATWRRTASSR